MSYLPLSILKNPHRLIMGEMLDHSSAYNFGWIIFILADKKAWSHTFVEIDHKIISTVILIPSADSFKKGCCQLQAKVCAQITG